MSHLLRHLAPLTEQAWGVLDAEAASRLKANLAGRRLVDFSGPHGWEYSATNLGRVRPAASPASGVQSLERVVLPVTEFRVGFAVSRAEMADLERGARDLDLTSLDDAARALSTAENASVLAGIVAASPHPVGTLGEDCDAYPSAVAAAVQVLREKGIGGPYGLAVGPAVYTRVIETAEHGGYLLLDHLRNILEGPVVWAPGAVGAVVISQRGGDYLFECGQDIAIGYDRHDADAVQLYLEESFSFRVATPEAAVALS